jgi:hypothetical protein
VTGTIVGLAGVTRTGTIRSQDGSRLAFSAAAVLGDYDTLAIGHLVSFELDRIRPRQVAVRVFREPRCASDGARKVEGPPDLRYAGFNSPMANIRSYRFDSVSAGRPVERFVVTVDLTLMMKHRVAIQEAPALCLHKLAADLKASAGSRSHKLEDADLLAYTLSRAATIEKRRLKHSLAGRRGSPPARPPDHTRVS